MRCAAIYAAFDQIAKRPRVVEIGCMFNEHEGLSTLILARAASKFTSIEYDAQHIEASREILARHQAARVDFRCGHSLALLPEVIKEMGNVDFFLLDGGAHPEVCLSEFEMALDALADDGVILVDDAQEIAPSPSYKLPRKFGKATLIYPMLIAGQYLAERSKYINANETVDGPNAEPASQSLAGLDPRGRDFRLFGERHKMLVFGPPAAVQAISTIATPSTRIGPLARLRNRIGF